MFNRKQALIPRDFVKIFRDVVSEDSESLFHLLRTTPFSVIPSGRQAEPIYQPLQGNESPVPTPDRSPLLYNARQNTRTIALPADECTFPSYRSFLRDNQMNRTALVEVIRDMLFKDDPETCLCHGSPVFPGHKQLFPSITTLSLLFVIEGP